MTTLARTVRKLLRHRKTADGTPMTIKRLAVVIGISRQSLYQLLAGRWVGSLRSGRVCKTSPALQRLRWWMQ